MYSRTGTLLAAGGLLATACLAPVHRADAAIVPFIGGETTVVESDLLTDFGIITSPFGTATLTGGTFTFPITGGFFDTDTGEREIEHEGSGETLTALADETVSLTIGNFVFGSSIFGDFIGGPQDVELFFSSDGGELIISTELAAALTTVFGTPDLTLEEFGRFNTSPQVIPVPAASGLLAVALALLGRIGLRRRSVG